MFKRYPLMKLSQLITLPIGLINLVTHKNYFNETIRRWGNSLTKELHRNNMEY